MTEEFNHARDAWRSARRFTDLCRLTADYVAGRQPFFPTTGGDPDPETNEISGYLERLNLGGLLTDCSQPGRVDSEVEAQRAFVDGFATRDVALGLARKMLYSDLHIQVFPPGVEAGYMVPVTVGDGHPYTWNGRPGWESLDGFGECSSPEAMRELMTCWYVIAIDLAWGRKEHLWQVLLEPERQGYSEQPHPDQGLALLC